MRTAQNERQDTGQRQIGAGQRHLTGRDIDRVVLTGLLRQRDRMASRVVLRAGQRRALAVVVTRMLALPGDTGPPIAAGTTVLLAQADGRC
ncbi:hypothetical protein, partial [Streptomyces canarius]